jgi:hypothetical protein
MIDYQKCREWKCKRLIRFDETQAKQLGMDMMCGMRYAEMMTEKSEVNWHLTIPKDCPWILEQTVLECK